MKIKITTWVLTVPLAALFLFAGPVKFSAEAAANFQRFGYGDGFRVFIGVAELAGAIGLLVPSLAFWASAGLAIIMAGAVYTHLAIGISPVFPGVAGLLLVVLAALRYRAAFLLSTRSLFGSSPSAATERRAA